MLLAIAAGTAEPIGSARLLQGCLTLRLGAVSPLEIRKREALLELDRAARHERAGTYVPLYDPGRSLRSELGNQVTRRKNLGWKFVYFFHGPEAFATAEVYNDSTG